MKGQQLWNLKYILNRRRNKNVDVLDQTLYLKMTPLHWLEGPLLKNKEELHTLIAFFISQYCSHLSYTVRYDIKWYHYTHAMIWIRILIKYHPYILCAALKHLSWLLMNFLHCLCNALYARLVRCMARDVNVVIWCTQFINVIYLLNKCIMYVIVQIFDTHLLSNFSICNSKSNFKME